MAETEVHVEHQDGSRDVIQTVKRSTEDYRYNRQDELVVDVARREANAARLNDGQDEIYLVEDGSDRFGGILRDVGRTGTSVVRLTVDSFERYARDTEPSTVGLQFTDVDDTSVVSSAIDSVDRLKKGQVDNIKSNLTFTFNNTSPARQVRVCRDVTSGVVRYNANKSVDYLTHSNFKTTRSTALTPKSQYIERLNVTQNMGDKHATHIRMLGSGSGDSQTVVEAVASNYSSDEREVWQVYANKEIKDSNTLREQGQELVDEMYEQHIEIEATLKGLDVSLGDVFTVNYNREDIHEDLEVVEHQVTIDDEGERHDVVLSSRSLSRVRKPEKVVQDVERFNRAQPTETLSVYDDPTIAPQEQGNTIYVTGNNGSYPRGIYYHNGSQYEGTQYPNVDASEVYASDAVVLPVGADQTDKMVLPTGTDQYST